MMTTIDGPFYGFSLSSEDEQKIRSIALDIATEGHYGIFRHDNKTPYIEHPKAVARIAVERFTAKHKGYIPSDMFRMMVLWIEVVSYFHDLIEDVEKWINKEIELVDHLSDRSKTYLPNYVKDFIVDALKRMNKHNFGSYLEFILSAMKNFLSHFAKEGDLTHNVSDLHKGSLKEKYILSLHIIKQGAVPIGEAGRMDITGLI